MQTGFFEIIGWLGGIGLLTGYFLFSVGKFDGRLWQYHTFNLISSALLLINAIHNASGPFIMVNTVWCFISAFYILKYIKNKGN